MVRPPGGMLAEIEHSHHCGQCGPAADKAELNGWTEFSEQKRLSEQTNIN